MAVIAAALLLLTACTTSSPVGPVVTGSDGRVTTPSAAAPSAAPVPLADHCSVATPNVPGGPDPWGGCFPGPGNTGVPKDVQLVDYSGPTTILTDNVSIEGQTVKGSLEIGGANVTVRNSRILGTISTLDEQFPKASLTLDSVTIDSHGAEGKSVEGKNITVKNSEITGSASGGVCSDCTIESSWFHDEWIPPTSLDHMSAYRMDRHTVLRHNTFSCDFDPTGMDPEAGCSAGLTGYPDFNAVEFNTVDRNLFVANAKSAFCAFGGSSTGKPFSGSTNHITFTDNVFQKGANGTCGSYGPITDFDRNAPGNVWSGNRWDDGTSLDPPAE